MALGIVDLAGFAPVGAHTSNNSLGTVVTLTPPAGADQIYMQAITQNIRYTLDGTAATTTLGFQLKAGDPPRLISLGATQTIKVIEETATAVLQFQWGS